MPDRTLSIEGVEAPRFLYGTAWKEDATQGLTALALEQGFRGVDTANQRRHYDEAAVGRAVAASIESGLQSSNSIVSAGKSTVSTSSSGNSWKPMRRAHPAQIPLGRLGRSEEHSQDLRS